MMTSLQQPATSSSEDSVNVVHNGIETEIPNTITDITEIAAETCKANAQPTMASSVANVKLTTTTTTMNATKIPTPLATTATTIKAPTQILTHKNATVPFQRSASMRVRGTKSNLLLQNSCNCNTHKENFIEQHENTSSSSSSSANNNNKNTPNNNTSLANHEMSTTGGSFSQRRKLVLRSSTPLIQRTHSGHQLLLRTTTTTTPKTLRSKLGHTTANTLQETKTLCSNSFALENTNNCENLNASESKMADTEKESPTAATAAAAAVGQQHKTQNRNMSLNLNGSQSNSNGDVVQRRTDVNHDDQDHVDDNGIGIQQAKGNNVVVAVSTKTSTTTTAAAVTPKTPRTPNTPPAAIIAAGQRQKLCNHHHQHQHQHQHQQQSATANTIISSSTKLSTVPETKLSPKTPPVTPDSPSTYLDDDLDSMYSFATTTSGRSTMSCDHPYVARNGTTFSGRKMKYVVHCSNYAGQVGPDYLTPTQRAQRQIKRLKELLCIARHDLEQKDTEIFRLTREVVELRLFKASLSSPEERSASSDAVTVREAELKTSQDVSPIVDMVDDAAAAANSKTSPRHMARLQQHHHQQQQINSEMQSSFADSGHFEDITTSSVHSKDSYAAPHMHDIACGSDDAGMSPTCSNMASGSSLENYELQRQELIRIYEQRIEELIRTQDTAASDLKRSHNDKVEALLQKLAECNTRYADIVPDYEHAKERIRELEKQLEDLQRKLVEHEEKQNKMYLHMYQKGQEAERIARADQALELAHRAPNSKVSINELLHQLQSTQDELENIRTIYRRLLEAQKNRTHVDPEVTLQFLKSAVYYFLTDKENSQGHLQAIESILEFTEIEKLNISKAHAPK